LKKGPYGTQKGEPKKATHNGRSYGRKESESRGWKTTLAKEAWISPEKKKNQDGGETEGNGKINGPCDVKRYRNIGEKEGTEKRGPLKPEEAEALCSSIRSRGRGNSGKSIGGIHKKHQVGILKRNWT